MAEPGSWDLEDEDFTDITDWADGDTDTGVSEEDPSGQLRLDTNSGAAGNAIARRTKDVGTLPAKFTVEVKIKCDLVDTFAGTADYLAISLWEGTYRAEIFFASDGLFVNNTSGTEINQGASLVKTGASAEFQTWRFVYDLDSGNVDIYLKDSAYTDWTQVGTGTNPKEANTTEVDGTIRFTQFGHGTDDMVSHVEYIKIATGLFAPEIKPTEYNVELRDSSGNFRQYLTPWVKKISWEWNRVGGCGNCQIKLAIPYKSIDFNVNDDIQIRIKNLDVSGTTKLVYRGWIADNRPKLDATQIVTLEVRGYFEKLAKLVVHSGGDTLTYTSKTISFIVDDIIDTFVVPNSGITKGTIDVAGFTADTLDFKSTVKSVLKTLADTEGGVEYGVDEDLVFFWLDESSAIGRKFFIGNDIKNFERRIDSTKFVNKFYLEGGDVAGTPYLRTAENTTSQARYFLSEKIVVNSSITTNSVADQYLGALLDQFDAPRIIITAKIVNTKFRLEDTLPIGGVAIVDPAATDRLLVWGTIANGGGNVTWGTTGNGGDNEIWGQTFSDQINKIKYELSESDGRFNISLAFGQGVLEAAALIKQLELELNEVRQGR